MAKNLIWPKIYIFGDSLTQFSFSKSGGWSSIIANEFQRKADIVARGFSGYNTRQCRALLPYLENDFFNVSIAGIFLGANDANDPKVNPQQSVPLVEYKDNLKYIINFMKNFGRVSHVFLITPPALDEDKWRSVCDSEGKPCGNKSTLVAQYVAACLDTAKEANTKCLDIHTSMLKQKDWQEMLCDGLHFSPKGSEFVASQMLPVLKTLMSECYLTTEENELMPLWRDVSNIDPDSSFKQWLDIHFSNGANS